jgi:hypothetical protein
MSFLDGSQNISETLIRFIFAGNDARYDWGSAENLTNVRIFREVSF